MTALDGPVMITGATGFVGSHLVSRLVERGCDVHAVIRPSTNLARVALLRGRVNLVLDDGDPERLVEAVGTIRPTVCFHLAAHVVGNHSYDDIDALVESNIRFGLRLAEALSRLRSSLLVNTGSFWQHVDGDRYRPAALYAATKQAFEDVLRWYAESGLLQVTTLVLPDTAGPGDHRPKFLNLLAEAAMSGTPLDASPGEQLIDLVHVDDVCEAFLAAAAAPPAASQRFAASSGSLVTLRTLATIVGQVLDRPVPVNWGAFPYRKREMFSPWLSDIPPAPGWQPARTLLEVVAATAVLDKSRVPSTVP